MKKIVILINDTTYAYNLRGAVIKRLIKEGYQVVVIGQLLNHQEELIKMGAKIIGVETGRHGKNPFSDIRLLQLYTKHLRREHPEIVLTYNIKPNVYGGLACRYLHIPYLPNITGLGTPVEQPGMLQKLTILLYKCGVHDAECVLFQNNENLEFFKEHRMLKKNESTKILPGSGVDLKLHPLFAWEEEKIYFLYAARIMKEKGIDLFLSAARKYASDQIEFHVCGPCDDPTYNRILRQEPSIYYHGEQPDLSQFYKKCSCFLYPSYYPEGMSNVLLEAAASGRPIIATNRCGCRETLEDGKTGFIVPINDVNKTLEATKRMIDLSSKERKNMGILGRKKIEKEFDREIVVNMYMQEIKKIERKYGL